MTDFSKYERVKKGLHEGHQQILNASDALLTFFPHPVVVLGKRREIQYLTTLRELRYFAKRLLVLRFTPSVANLSPKSFLSNIAKTIAPKKIVVGYDFKFGHKKAGDVDTLRAWGKEQNIKIEIIPPFLDATRAPVKSSAIRESLDDNFARAVTLMRHPYLIIGKVIPGDARGRKLGFPTANLKVPQHKKLPSTGVYKGYVQLGKSEPDKKCAVYIGKKPSFSGQKVGVEVHILNYSGNLYDKIIKVFLEKKIRNEQQFDSPEKLIAQIEKDVVT